ncbi:MAG TPA: metalloregulator ArsR/SmtB family transcription factor [Gemmataceae bacterium]|nr:metalloregulator ArsR/SmtB family transcription factor [Gemmataceae bacterium]
MNAFSAITTKPRANKVPSRDTSPLRVSVRTISGLAQVFKQLADESRLKILLALAQDRELNVTSLCELLGQSQPAVSHHLTLLRMTGLVGYRRDGKHNFYRIQSSLVCDLLEQFFADSGNGHKQINFEEFSLAYKRK